MDALILVIARAGAQEVVMPRRLRVDVRPGSGLLRHDPSPPLDGAATASLAHAWAAAKALAGRGDTDATLGFAGPTPLQGGSAGLTFGLVALAALLGETLPPFFATGGVVTPHGDLEGGLAAQAKAEAAARLAPQQGLQAPPFLCPPLARPPEAPSLRVACAADMGTAYARLHPAGYAKVEARHRALRRPDPASLAAGWVEVEEGGVVLWRTRAPADGAGMDAARALARRCSVLAG